MRRTITIVSPVYNECEIITTFYAELKKVLDAIADSYESTICFVVDRSTDGTLDILRDIARVDRSVRVIAMTGRFGHQMCLLAGIDYSDSDVLIMLDSDLQHPPDLIPIMLRYYEEGYDVVYTIREDTNDVHFAKRVASKLFYRLLNQISQVPINENAADFRLISRRVVKVFQKRIRERNLFLRGFFEWMGFRSIAVPFKVRKRAGGFSKYSFTRMFRFALDGVISFSKQPLRAATVFGLLIALFGFLLSFVTAVQYFIFSSFPSGWTTLVVLMSIFSGTQLVFLGVIGEYIGAIFDEVKARPHYIIDELINFNENTEEN
ncbi:glycosyltransferase family 2 protein [Roseiflexus sp. RS-1]|jgi:dolichol-phosphate mannosyltransferase|uniref:glycosyltransferase family 2 protein n=1 Tax=Roseiflexus sp. (strain RS-1) TaxID=357808 RepID=UPI0000D82883|nr:glycosyltransferase family 2 protein [Roseiflexus sp. RS-1]ABQ92425.1 glycosyl transferase, family 2 [Roseiflexus sp. RS-1]